MLVKPGMPAPRGRFDEDDHAPTLNVPEVAAIVAAAHARGVKVNAHVINVWELKTALDGGVDVIAHPTVEPIPDDLLKTMLDRRLPMISTLNIWGVVTDTAAAVRNVGAFHQRGGIIAMGTDYPFQTFDSLPLDELQLLQRAGLSPAQVLLASTRDAATVCGLEDVGTIKVGNVADLIKVEGDPTRDLAALSHVSTVIQAGQPVV